MVTANFFKQRPDWAPTQSQIKQTNIYKFMRELRLQTVDELRRWSVENREEFTRRTIEKLGIKFTQQPTKILDTSEGRTNAKWFVNAKMNIMDSCFQGDPNRIALTTRRHDGTNEDFTVDQLDRWSNRVANSLVAMGLQNGDSVAIDMPMTAESVAIYCGIIKAGMVAVSVPDSLPAEQIAVRLEKGDAKAVFTQTEIMRGELDPLPLYDRICDPKAKAPQAIVLTPKGREKPKLREGDLHWDDFLGSNDRFRNVVCSPDDNTNIIYSSGTTGDPKAIPWTHTTPIKSAADAKYNQDIKEGDVVCWPTNLGWMMGPWLVYAGLINRAKIAIYEGPPTESGFCKFVEDVKVTMLGLVPSIVNDWRSKGYATGFDWSSIRCFSSSGEASSPEAYRWLMGLNQKLDRYGRTIKKAIIEYCGGTEVGGGYAAGTLAEPQNASEFPGAALGINFVIRNQYGKECAPGESGEVFLVGPSVGLSQKLHKGDNFKTYYKGCVGDLRRHGDRFVRLINGYFRSDGREDDAIKIKGQNVSSAELERAVNDLPNVKETAAIGVPEAGRGTNRLVIYMVFQDNVKLADVNLGELKAQMQSEIRQHINSTFSIHEIVPISALPRTASNKVMRRVLRDDTYPAHERQKAGAARVAAQVLNLGEAGQAVGRRRVLTRPHLRENAIVTRRNEQIKQLNQAYPDHRSILRRIGVSDVARSPREARQKQSLGALRA